MEPPLKSQNHHLGTRRSLAVLPDIRSEVRRMSGGLTATPPRPESCSETGSHDCAQLSAPKEHHSTCRQRTHLPLPRSHSALKCSQTLTSAAAEGEPRGDGPDLHHPSPSGGRCHAIALPSPPPPSPSFSVKVGTRPAANEGCRLLFCRCGVSFSAVINNRRSVNGRDAPLTIKNKKTPESGRERRRSRESAV